MFKNTKTRRILATTFALLALGGASVAAGSATGIVNLPGSHVAMNAGCC